MHCRCAAWRARNFRDREDAPAVLLREAIIKHTGLQRPRSTTLNNDRRAIGAEIFLRLFWCADEFHPDTALAHIGFQNEWIINVVLDSKRVERRAAFGSWRAAQQTGLRGEFPTGA